MKKHWVFLLLAAAALFSCLHPAEAASKKKRSVPVDRYASIVIDAETGFVLSEKNADKKLHPASLTKMMTLYMTFDALERGILSKNQRLSVSRRAELQEPSKLGLRSGSTIRTEDAILGLVTKSANDAAVVLADAIGGSETRFAKLMTQRARALGMTHTNFVNASGLHNPAQVSTARDMAILSQALIRDFPRQYRYFSTGSFTYAGVRHNNHNKLMNSYAGMDGLKTGYVYASGYNLAASAVRGGKRLIGVVFGGRTSQSRNQHMASLMNAGFDRIHEPRIAGLIQSRRAALLASNTSLKKGTTATTAAKTQLALNSGMRPSVPLQTPRFDAMGLVVEQGDAGEEPDVSLTQNRKVALASPVTAPESFQPRAMNTSELDTRMALAAPPGGWAVQIGAFSSHTSGMAALKSAHDRLPRTLTTGSQYLIVPLVTNRGMIYRARLSGLGRDAASNACRILKGNCLILAMQ